MNRCLICFKNVEETINNNHVCNDCLKQLEVIEKVIKIDGKECLILYKYNDFFKDVLYRYKGCFDYALKDVFLTNYILKLKFKYRRRKIVCAPSYFRDDKKRGFNHVKEISKLLNLEVIDCLEKVKNYKQSDQKMNERYHIQNVIRIDKTKLKGVKRVLIVDDVTTSLSTLKTIIRLLPTNIDIKILVLASNCRFVENKKI